MTQHTDPRPYETGADPYVSDETVWDSLSAEYGGGWEDSTDIRTRYGEVRTGIVSTEG